MDGLPPATKSAKTSSSTLAGGASSSLTDMSNVALRHTFRFADARKLAAAECLAPRVAQVARAAVVEAADKRYGIALEPVPGAGVRVAAAGAGGARRAGLRGSGDVGSWTDGRC